MFEVVAADVGTDI